MKHLLSIVLSTILLTTCLAANDGPPPSLVQTTAVKSGVINPLQSYVGTLYFDVKSDLASELDGAVHALYFTEGQRVKKGDAMIELDSEILHSNIKAKEAQLDAQLAELEKEERDLERNKALLERKSISERGYEEVFYRVKQLKAQSDVTRNEIASLKIEADKRTVRAPFDGIVTARNVQIGEWVAKGATVATIVAPSSIEARLNLPASLLPTLKEHRNFQATVGNEEIALEIKTIIPVADVATRTFEVELALPERDGLIEGMRIDIMVPTLKNEEAMLVPRDAVIKRFGQTVVFAVVDGQAMMLPVQVIGYKENMAAISAQGLKKGMSVVTKGNERIFPNMPVREQKGE